VRTIVNFVEHLGDEFDIRIVTSDRDALDTTPYADVAVDRWNAVGKAKVFYASKKVLTLQGIARLLCETPHDLLYLNSYLAFSFTTLPLLARQLGIAPKKPCVIAPRGEFSLGALQLKAEKKQLFILLAKILRLHQGLFWQASSDHERCDIIKCIGSIAKCIMVAPDLLPVVSCEKADTVNNSPETQNRTLRVVFLSRISPMKNLDYFLRLLKKATTRIDVSIYGILEDVEYWEECERLIQELPSHIVVHYHGEVNPQDVLQVFSAHDVFFFPTRGENFGHVIFEALSVGTSVVLSDQTPWMHDQRGAVEVIPLEGEDAWAQALERWAAYSNEELIELRQSALSYAHDYVAKSIAVQQNRDLFAFAARHCRKRN